MLKHQIMYVATAVLLCLTSCQKEEIAPPPANVELAPVHKMQDADNGSCKLYDAFKEKFCVIKGKYEVIPYPLYARIGVTTSQGDYNIQPIKSEAGGTDFIVQFPDKPEKDYVITATSYWYFLEKVDPNLKVAPEVQAMYTFADLVEKNEKDADLIYKRLQKKATVTFTPDGLNLKFTEAFPPESIPIRVYAIPRCIYDEARTVKQYMNLIGWNTNTFASSYEYMIEESLNTCNYTCYACADPICVFNDLYQLAVTNVSTTDQQKIKTAFLRYGLGLSEEETSVAANDSYAEARNALFDFLRNSDFCANTNVGLEVIDFLKSHQGSVEKEYAASAVVTAYIKLIEEDNEYMNEYIVDWNNGTVEDPALLYILKEQLLLAIQEVIIDVIPGGTIITVGPELLDNLDQGDFLSAMWNAVDIVLNEADVFLPQAKIADFALGLTEKYRLIKNVYISLKNARSGGTEFVIKLYETLRTRFGVSELKQKMQWLGSSLGVKLEGVTAAEFFQDVKNNFGAAIIPDLQHYYGEPPVIRPVFKIGAIPIGNKPIVTELYPESDSGYAWTIGFFIYTGEGALPAIWNSSNNNKFGNIIKFRLDN